MLFLRLKTFGAGVLLSLLTIGCQTMPEKIAYKLPENLSADFHPCHKGDGGGAALFESADGAISAEYEWIKEKDFRGRLYNPIGQTVLGFYLEEGSLAWGFTGPLKDKVPKVALDEKGFVVLDGNWAGLTLKEAVCLWQGKWPKKWLSEVYRAENSEEKVGLFLQDEKRHIKLDLLKRKKGKRQGASCAQIKWYGFWFMFPQELSLCLHHQAKSLSMEVAGYRARWDMEE